MAMRSLLLVCRGGAWEEGTLATFCLLLGALNVCPTTITCTQHTAWLTAFGSSSKPASGVQGGR